MVKAILACRSMRTYHFNTAIGPNEYLGTCTIYTSLAYRANVHHGGYVAALVQLHGSIDDQDWSSMLFREA
eukprot:jgi/Botrbrau1/16694/Bobra.0267s0010.1